MVTKKGGTPLLFLPLVLLFLWGGWGRKRWVSMKICIFVVEGPIFYTQIFWMVEEFLTLPSYNSHITSGFRNIFFLKNIGAMVGERCPWWMAKITEIFQVYRAISSLFTPHASLNPDRGEKNILRVRRSGSQSLGAVELKQRMAPWHWREYEMLDLWLIVLMEEIRYHLRCMKPL